MKSAFTIMGALVLSAAYLLAAAPDLSSPISTMKSLYEAAERGDEDAIRQAFYAETDAQRELAEAYSSLVVAGKRLADAAKKKYGDSADALAQGAFPAAEIDKLEAATVKEDGDSATLLLPQATEAIHFRRSDAGWQIVLDAGNAQGKLPGQIALVREFAQASSELAADIAAGKHATIQDAESAIQQRMNEVTSRMVREHPPTTRPASAPATRPSP